MSEYDMREYECFNTTRTSAVEEYLDWRRDVEGDVRSAPREGNCVNYEVNGGFVSISDSQVEIQSVGDDVKKDIEILVNDL